MSRMVHQRPDSVRREGAETSADSTIEAELLVILTYGDALAVDDHPDG